MGYWNFFKGTKAATSQDKVRGRMPKRLDAETPKASSPGDGDGNVRPVDPGEGNEVTNNIPKPLSGAPAKE
jgi:hypothetical protein